jgi:hypothetical protein
MFVLQVRRYKASNHQPPAEVTSSRRRLQQAQDPRLKNVK